MIEVFKPEDDEDQDYDFYGDEDDNDGYPGPRSNRASAAGSRGLPPGTEPLRRREILEPLGRERMRSEKVIPFRGGSELYERITKEFGIAISEPKVFDECPKLVDSLKSRKPVIINLENIENDTARKIFDFLSGATYALNGNVQKIAQNIFVFLPENVDVQASSESQSYKYGEDKNDPWR
jgi:FtsZ-interacting cell division protein YlmF